MDTVINRIQLLISKTSGPAGPGRGGERRGAGKPWARRHPYARTPPAAQRDVEAARVRGDAPPRPSAPSRLGVLARSRPVSLTGALGDNGRTLALNRSCRV